MTIGGTWLDWKSEEPRWPHHQASRFVSTTGFDWHVQVTGPEGAPIMLLLHGTGASSHSWRNLIPLLSDRFQLIVPDLPCHGFTRPRSAADLSLDGMAKAVSALLAQMSIRPDIVVGHSAGAAIAVALASTLMTQTSSNHNIKHVVGINGAFLPIRGNRLLSPMAKALFANPFSASMFSLLSKATPLGGNLLRATGSTIDTPGREIYRALLGSSGHVRGAIGMMAAWDLSRFDALLHRLPVPLTLIATRDDPMVPYANSAHAAKLAPAGRMITLNRGGHLVHECDAPEVARQIEHAFAENLTNGADAA